MPQVARTMWRIDITWFFLFFFCFSAIWC